ncbi:ankyrin repeat domain-containing protein [Enterovibrio norvegicus]|uniref:ankyrin repeat domain-containing protein n=1 Tax=Enterovibrio norvegicus TaxID=188144 RepID=UPI00352D86D3
MPTKNLLFIVLLTLSFSVFSYEELIHTAVAEGELEKVNELIKSGVSVEQPTKNERKDSPLHFAVELEKIEIVKLLLENGANPNKLNGIGYAPIHYASDVDINILMLLIEYGGNVNLKAFNGTNVLQTAMQNENLMAFRYLLKKGANANGEVTFDQPIVCSAVLYDNPEFVSLLVKYGAELNHTNCLLDKINREFVAPIQIEKCDVTRIKLLKSLGAKTNISSSNGKTIRDFAIEVEGGWDNGKDCNQVINYLEN